MWDWTGASDTPWYNIRASITSVVIGNGVQNIGNYAFYDVSQMSGATISLTVSRIGNQAFRNCDGMTKIEIPYSVEAIGEYAFYDCDGLITVQIPGSVLSVGNYAFTGCGKLTEASLSSGMSGIPPYMFQNCSSLLDLNFPVSITGVGAYAFNGCTKLRDVYYGGSEDQWSQVTVGVNNVPLLNANIIFESLPTTVSVTGVGLDQETMVLKAGETGLLTVTVAPANATNSNVSWSTSNPNVATVSNGMVTAVGAGTAAITVTTEDGSKTASCTVTVPKPDDPTPVGDVPLKLVTSYSKRAKTATINIVTTSPITLANYDMQLGWDQSVFTLSGTANGQSGKLSTFVSNLNSTKDDYGKISAMTDGNNATIAANEILASYTLTTVNALSSGDYAFSLKVEEVADQNAEPLS